MTITTHKFEDNNFTYYTTSDNKVYFHRDSAEKHEKHLRKEQTRQRYYVSFNLVDIHYEDMKQWLKDNQLLVQDMIQEP